MILASLYRPMMKPSTEDLYARERILHQEGMRVIVGIDEVGYGSLAGPVTVAACVLDATRPIADIKDSKAFSSHRRRSEVSAAIKEGAIAYAIAHRPNTLIDTIGIVGALQEAQRECVERIGIVFNRVLVDGTPYKRRLGYDEEYVVKGDANVACIAAASILAKVARDELMMSYEMRYPPLSCYGFARNKGYGTSAHREAIELYGLSPLHRRCYCANLIE
jgi:ribonuclease HII